MSFEEVWETQKLKDLCLKIGSGATPTGGKDSYKKSGISLIRSQNVYNHSFSYEGLAYIDENQAKKLDNVTVQKDDVLLNITGDSVCRCCIVPSDVLPARVNQHVSIIRTDQTKIYPFFVKSFLTTEIMQNYMLSLAQSGGTRAALTKGMIENFEIPVPELNEQMAIVRVLFALDKKIELNNAINKNLEEMAQALFKRWFVDFEFPNENGEPYKSSGGEFEESELGLIPKGWKTGCFGDISICYDSKRIPLSKKEREVRKKVYPYYGAASLMDYVDQYLFSGVHVLMGEDGTVINDEGYPVLQYVWGKFWVNNHAHVLKGNSNFSEEYIYLLLKRTNVRHIVTGAVQPKINQANMKGIKVIIPENSVLKQFNQIIDGLFKLIRQNSDENCLLTNARDTLLPKLMSGEIRVPLEESYSEPDLPMVAESKATYQT